MIGFAGNVPGSLILHPDDEHILYALGSTIVVKQLNKNQQYFLQCGSNQTAVSCMKLSNDGKLLATGQKTHAGFPVCTSTHSIIPFLIFVTQSKSY